MTNDPSGLTRRDAGIFMLGAAAAPVALATPVAPGAPATSFNHVPWSRQAGIYEVNLRQFTPEGTLKAFEAHLPRLKKMGVGILWLMPLQPIGVKNRKGSLGSYYAVRDYTAVNAEFGTLADLKQVVNRAHGLGMKVILDWVANHTAWDHAWVEQHPDWYLKDAKGEIGAFSHVFKAGDPPEVWEDVVGLDYANPALWPAMTDALLFWQREAGVDGFRCDVASLVPTLFWEQARAALERVRPVFMLAEADVPALHAKAFDMTYDWALYDVLKRIAKGQASAADVRSWWQTRQAKYPADAIGMNFTGNHDSNSWDGSDSEYYGSRETFKAMTMLTFMLPGMPLIYGGQEAFFEKRLKFFERDTIDWKQRELAPFYAQLLAHKRRHPALAAGVPGDAMAFNEVDTDAVLAFSRGRGADRLAVNVNLSPQAQAFSVAGGARQTLAPWAWSVLAR